MHLPQNRLVDPGKPPDRCLGNVVLIAAATVLEAVPTLPPEVVTTPFEQGQELNRCAVHGS